MIARKNGADEVHKSLVKHLNPSIQGTSAKKVPWKCGV